MIHKSNNAVHDIEIALRLLRIEAWVDSIFQISNESNVHRKHTVDFNITPFVLYYLADCDAFG